MKKRHLYLLFVLGLGVFLLLSACGGLTEDEAAGAEEPTLPQSTTTVGVPDATPAVTPVPSLPERRQLTLEFPATIRAGDADTIRLTLEIDEMGFIVPTAEVDGNVVTGEAVEIPNLYDTHHVLAQARLDIAGIEIVPTEIISEPLLPGEQVTFYWSLRPEDEGEYRGRVWFYLRFTPKEGGETLTRTISSLPVEIETTTFLGLKAGAARWLGALGSFISGILGMPFFEEIAKWLWKRITGS